MYECSGKAVARDYKKLSAEQKFSNPATKEITGTENFCPK
jgi:hypothetical protein